MDYIGVLSKVSDKFAVLVAIWPMQIGQVII